MDEELEFLSHTRPSAKKSSGKSFDETVTLDNAIDHYVDIVLEDQKQNYTSQLESFESYESKFREKAKEELYSFKDHFLKGYELLLSELKLEFKDDEAALAPFVIRDDKFAAIDSFEKITQFFGQEKLLYQLLEYTPQMLTQLYKAAYKITEEKRFQDGYDAYFFLISIAPHIREAWLNFGFACSMLGEHLSGVEAFSRALELDPTKADSYLAICGAYMKVDNYDDASRVCDIGIGFAEKHASEPWATDLTSALNQAKYQIQNRH